MSPGLAFLAGLFTGATIGVIVMGSLMAQVVADLRQRIQQERDRRIAAEDSAQAQLDDDVRVIGEFPPVLDFLDP